MKLALHDNEFETNVETKSQDFTVGDISKIISILRNLYEHKIRSAVQEYMSNARDAMREARTSKRIVVSIPNHLNPVFKVRDFGPGITPTRMSRVFIQYGSTTKDTTNSQAGGFGIGAKSAWAYTDSFTIVSITKGMKRTYVAHLGKNKQGSLDLIGEEPSDEATGTEIQIAVKSGDLGEFKDAIWRACYFWTDKEYPEFKGVTALDVPQRKKSTRVGDLELIADDLPGYLGLEQNYYKDTASVVIDGIPYSPDKTFLGTVPKLQALLRLIKSNAVLHVGNGILDIPPSRESIDVSEINREVLGKLAETSHTALVKHIKSEFTKATTVQEWIKIYKELNNTLNVDDHARRGDYRVTAGVLFSQDMEKIGMLQIYLNFSRRATGTNIKREDSGGIPLNQLNNLFHLDAPDEAVVTQNRRVAEYCQGNRGCKVILLRAGSPKAQMSDSEKILAKIVSDLGVRPLSSLPYTPPVREARQTRVKEKEALVIHAHSQYRKHLRHTTIERAENDGDKYLYVKFLEYDKFKNEFNDMRKFFDSLGYSLCALSPDTIKTVSGSKNFKSYETWMKAFKPDDKIVAACCADKAAHKNEMGLLSSASVKIKDKKIVEMIEAYKPILKNNVQSVPKTISAMVSKQIKEFTDSDNELTKLLRSKYSLIARVTGSGQSVADEVALYINAKA